MRLEEYLQGLGFVRGPLCEDAVNILLSGEENGVQLVRIGALNADGYPGVVDMAFTPEDTCCDVRFIADTALRSFRRGYDGFAELPERAYPIAYQQEGRA
jgi:hypothetical protein